jgi:sulfide dehydrogenase cytochrome subunit
LIPWPAFPRTRTLQKLAEFKSGDKPASIMHQISKGYTDEQLDLIATYFAAQK